VINYDECDEINCTQFVADFQTGINADTKAEYLVNSNVCKIVNTNEWDESIIEFYRPVENDDPVWPLPCDKMYPRHWTFIENSVNINGVYIKNTHNVKPDPGFTQIQIGCNLEHRCILPHVHLKYLDPKPKMKALKNVLKIYTTVAD